MARFDACAARRGEIGLRMLVERPEQEINLGVLALLTLVDVDLDPIAMRWERAGVVVEATSQSSRAVADLAALLRAESKKRSKRLPQGLRDEIEDFIARLESRIVPGLHDRRATALEETLACVPSVGTKARRRCIAAVLLQWGDPDAEPAARAARRRWILRRKPKPAETWREEVDRLAETLRRRFGRRLPPSRESGMTQVETLHEYVGDSFAASELQRAGLSPPTRPWRVLRVGFPTAEDELVIGGLRDAMFETPTLPVRSRRRRALERLLVSSVTTPQGRAYLADALELAQLVDRLR